MTPRVLIAEPDDFSEPALGLLREHCDVTMEATVPADLPAAFANFDAVWVRLASRVGAAEMGAAPRCRVLATATTGLDHIDLQAAAARNVQVVSLKGEAEFLRTVVATAEHTLALTLALLRRLAHAAEHVESGGWDRDLFRGSEIYGKRVGLVGVGRLGQLTARLFGAFGATVWGYDPRADFPADVERCADLALLAEKSDIVSVHAVFDESTEGLLGKTFFERLKPGAVLINTARGGIVDETAMLAALQHGRLGGVALDVLSGEPAIDASHPVVAYGQGRPEVLLTPHIGGNTRESFVKTETFVANKVLRALGIQP